MDEGRLSPRERQILAAIENGLREDEALDRKLRSMRRVPHGPVDLVRGVRRHALALCVALLAVLTTILLVAAVATNSPGFIWAFAAVWVLTLTGLLRLVIRWTQRWCQDARRPEGD